MALNNELSDVKIINYPDLQAQNMKYKGFIHPIHSAQPLAICQRLTRHRVQRYQQTRKILAPNSSH